MGTNWNDPARIANDYAAFVKLIHVLGGLYIWEFFANLDFEWDVFCGKRKYRWTLWLYIGCRVAALSAVITMFVGYDAGTPINCEAWNVFVFIFPYTTFVCASALIVLRIAAIWEKNWLVLTTAILAWLTNTGFYLHSVVISRAVWDAKAGWCAVLNSNETRDNIVVTLVTDLLLLFLMSVGLLRWRRAGMVGGIWSILYNQGLLWVLVVTLAEVPATVFILLDLNPPFNLMFQVPELVIMAIGASRIYRGLADYRSLSELEPETGRSRWSAVAPFRTSHVTGSARISQALGAPDGTTVYVMSGGMDSVKAPAQDVDDASHRGRDLEAGKISLEDSRRHAP
ncbi:hypothetical protein BV25DRAFT_1912860 [Artomyces pyxidatus]|uniref:Uncharacterized protein n=1 Tax=Artomyces pyxidatus TaxID=48021 RepID=A0ACB8TC96_9AGAM|nr:hypothetical protein BV25DRAFT_1912860 [Artomyces pyxidatus]